MCSAGFVRAALTPQLAGEEVAEVPAEGGIGNITGAAVELLLHIGAVFRALRHTPAGDLAPDHFG